MVTIIAANAQAKNYWVVETNTTGRSIVKIYDAENKLVDELKVERRIDINKKKERRTLNKMVRSRENAGLAIWSKR